LGVYLNVLMGSFWVIRRETQASLAKAIFGDFNVFMVNFSRILGVLWLGICLVKSWEPRDILTTNMEFVLGSFDG